jgi:CDGSH-type Zn-finger protein
MHTMTDPIIADNTPATVDLTAGEEYHWCACGRSANQPFCDGSHVGTDFSPTAFTVEADGEAYLCACKQTGNAPYCDGSHTQITPVQVGTTGSPSATATDEQRPTQQPGAAPAARPTPEEPTVAFIHELARDGLTKVGHHGPMTSMGVPRKDLPHWDDIQIMAA